MEVVRKQSAIKYFLSDSRKELVCAIEEIKKYEKKSLVCNDSKLILSVYRRVHTLKGSASFLSFEKTQAIANSLEIILDYLLKSEVVVSKKLIDVILASLDNCLKILDNIEVFGDEINGELKDLIYKTNNNLKIEFQALTRELKPSKMLSTLNYTVVNSNIFGVSGLSMSGLFGHFKELLDAYSEKHNKKINLNFESENIKLSYRLQRVLNTSFIHMIRNSIDHGIESEEKRLIRGKKSVGQISIKAWKSEEQIFIEFSDDGNGIDVSKFAGREVPDLAISSEKINLIFYPGFTTLSRPTDTSGRGMGMHIVRTHIEEIGGTCEVESEVGEGTLFKIKIPVGLNIE